MARQLTVLSNRLELARNRDDTRQWVQDRRARTRHLIELGGLVQKAGLVELLDDDRATLLGAFLDLAAQLRDPDRSRDQSHGQPGTREEATPDASAADRIARWRRRGLREFDADASPRSEQPASPMARDR